jgi:hypothetical protein
MVRMSHGIDDFAKYYFPLLLSAITSNNAINQHASRISGETAASPTAFVTRLTPRGPATR